MAAADMHNPAEGYVQTAHPVQGLPRVVRHITGHNAEGKSVFLSTDVGDHHRELVNKSAIANILYSTNQHPVELNGEVDVKYAQGNEVRFPPCILILIIRNSCSIKHGLTNFCSLESQSRTELSAV